MSQLLELHKNQTKHLYDYQLHDLNRIFDVIQQHPDQYNLLYQLPTGGGKTVIFSEIVRRYINQNKKKVVILTHRIELCKQTSKMLTALMSIIKLLIAKSKSFEIKISISALLPWLKH